MFPTFTGNSRRPRNVNLSGSVGNPFANTSWSPSTASTTKKTVLDAKADRERRQADRERLKAASRIQRSWRGHRERCRVSDMHRAAFDRLYTEPGAPGDTDRLHRAFVLLLSFCRPAARLDDLRRLQHYAYDAAGVTSTSLWPAHPTRLPRLLHVINSALESASTSTTGTLTDELRLLLRLATQILEFVPQALSSSGNRYFAALAALCKKVQGEDWLQDVLESLRAALTSDDSSAFAYFTREFLTEENITLFEDNIESFAAIISPQLLSEEIGYSYSSRRVHTDSSDGLMWLLAHTTDLTRTSTWTHAGIDPIRSLFIQLSALTSEISARVTTPNSLTAESEGDFRSPDQPDNSYISRQLLWLSSSEGTSNILRYFTANSSQPSCNTTSLLAGYLLTLLQSFSGKADDIRMRLFLEQVTTGIRSVPTVKFLWQMAQETQVFKILRDEPGQTFPILNQYLNDGPLPDGGETDSDQEWRIILLFLELYTFILRLSDDQDFFSGIHPSPLQENSSPSRIQTCSLSLEDVKSLSLFLKNIAFTLYYKGHELCPVRRGFLESQHRNKSAASAKTSPKAIKLRSTKLDLDSLRDIVSSTMTMLYERDSRKAFLPKDHWLITDQLQQEDFVGAVLAEEKRQRQEALSYDSHGDGDDEDDGDEDEDGLDRMSSREPLAGRAAREKIARQQRRAQRERRLAELGPKLAVLKHMPFAVPFDTRVRIFRLFIDVDKELRGRAPDHAFPVLAKHAAQIRRGQLFEDAFEELYKIGDGLKDPIAITFVDQFDEPEAGIDGGGVTKEFLISVISEALSGHEDGINMFTASPSGLLYPNPIAIDAIKETMRVGHVNESFPEWRQMLNSQLRRYEFLGRLVGKCMYEGILVDVNFAGFFLLKWPSAGPDDENNYKGSINDLRDLDEELYNGMLRLKNYPGDVSELDISFTVSDQVSMPKAPIKTVTKLLVANGDQVYVTNDNRPLYISYMARHRLVVQSAPQTAAFLRGLRAIIRPSWLSMFNQSELQRLVGGDSSEIDLEDLRKNTVYSGLYELGDDKEEHPTIKIFWKVMHEFTDEKRRNLLKYVSSTPRAPLLGFSQLRPLFCIRSGGNDEERLPSASTCINLLKLPVYKTEERLREKLLYAITSGAGFDLS
ncbi:IQ and HECT domain protein [Cordyceps fumosorosea ARSEF 2679]|uniref:HECT-type E3 ubiquitin transferase n=1 Tax=Cordyceps fumosorosea (strain ARSEF 2679) TaxID=1081104 RepID=A0A167SC97_CORFA|nr:IQ and HECT domain protein [Cordyceps fumosorosea ARSEF 2679]OAA59479.1 IQ and HECT domain protein [Cordyceps fumosorosea ARSEF 2679]